MGKSQRKRKSSSNVDTAERDSFTPNVTASTLEGRSENGVRHSGNANGGNATSKPTSEDLAPMPSPPHKGINGDRVQPEGDLSNAVPPWRGFLWQDFHSDPEAAVAAAFTSATESRNRVYRCTFGVPAAFEKLEFFLLIWMVDSVISTLLLLPVRMASSFLTKFSVSVFDLLQVSIVAIVTLFLFWNLDVAWLYHTIRGQDILKLYVVFTMLEVVDRLCSANGSDILMAMLSSTVKGKRLDALMDWLLNIVIVGLNSCVLMAQAAALNVVVNSQDSGVLWTLIISNNYTEIKANVFKKVDDEKLFLQAKVDALERFHLATCLLLVLTQTATHHNLSPEWWFDFCRDSLIIVLVEILADNIKHSFLAKFNNAGPKKYKKFRYQLAADFMNGAPIFSRTWVTPLVQAAVLIRGVLPVFSQMSRIKFLYAVPLSLLLVVAVKLGTRALLYSLSRKILINEEKID